MQSINGNLFSLDLSEIDYRLSGLRVSQHRIILQLLQGKPPDEIARQMRITRSALSARIASACDRVGCQNRSQLMGMFAIWKYSQDHTEYQSQEPIQTSQK